MGGPVSLFSRLVGVSRAANPVAAQPSRHLGQLLDDVLLTFRTEEALIEVARHQESHRFTYGQVRQQARALAGWLLEQGLQPGERVAIVMTNRSAWLIAATAVFRAGGVLVPLDYKLTPPELDALLAHAEPRWLIAEHGLARKLTWPGSRLLIDAREAEHRFEDVLDGPAAPVVPRDPEDIATLVYSSGTGGTPKGCQLSHRAYLAQIDALLALYPMKPGQRFFSILPTNHAIDFMCGFLATFCCGATVVHQRTLRPAYLRSTMERYQITHMAAVPMVLESLQTAITERIDELPPRSRAVIDGLLAANATLTERRPLPAVSQTLLKPLLAPLGGQLQLVFTGGTFVRPELAEFFYRLGISVVIGYGLTEAGTVVTVEDLAPFRADAVGAPVPGTSIRIADPDPKGVGEVQVSGPTLMSGYFREPALTAETFTEDGWLKTGDLGWIDASGHLHLVGRSRNLIVTPGGKNLYPEDVEGAFHDVEVDGLAVFAQGFVWPGSTALGEERLIAVVEGEAPLEALRSANRRLASHKRIQAVLAWDGTFPRTASMKLKRAALAEAVRHSAAVEGLVDL